MIFISAQTGYNNKKRLLELAVNWNCLDGAEVIFKSDPVFYMIFFFENVATRHGFFKYFCRNRDFVTITLIFVVTKALSKKNRDELQYSLFFLSDIFRSHEFHITLFP